MLQKLAVRQKDNHIHVRLTLSKTLKDDDRTIFKQEHNWFHPFRVIILVLLYSCRLVLKEARISVMYSVDSIMAEISLSTAKEQRGCHMFEV